MSVIKRFIEIVVNNTAANKNLQQTTKQLEEADKATENLSGSIDNLSGGAISSFNGMIGTAKNLVKGFGALKTAWIATGFGALAILVLSLVEYFTNFEKGVQLVTKAFNFFGGAINAIVGSFSKLLEGDFAGFFSDVADGATDAAKATDALFEAQNRLYELQKESVVVNAQLEVELEKQLKIMEDTTKPVQQRLDAQKEINRLSAELLNSKREELQIELQILDAKIKIENNEQKRKDLELEKSKLQADLIKTEGEINAKKEEGAKKTREILQAERDRIKAIKDKATEEALRRQEELLKFIEDRYKKIDQAVRGVNAAFITLTDFVVGSLTPYANESRQLIDIWANAAKASSEFGGAIEELKKKRDELLSQGRVKDAAKVTEEIIKQEKAFLDQLPAAQQIADTVQNELKTREDLYNNYMKTLEVSGKQKEMELLKLSVMNDINNSLFEYEKAVDGRDDNSQKYNEIITRTNILYSLQRQIINEKFKAEREANKTTTEDLRRRLGIAERLRDSIKDESELKRSDFKSDEEYEQERIRLIQEKAKANRSVKDLTLQLRQSELKGKELELQQNYELDILMSQQNIDLERYTLAQKQLLREEDLERQRMYYDAGIGIAEEASGFLNDIAQLGGKNAEKFAKAALRIQQVAGVAKVVISTQEEIRGIWANPALTALPDTGVTKKTLLTAAAVARGGLSIATILKQRIGGSPSSSSASGGGGAAATPTFNIVESSGNNQLAAAIGAQQNQPVNAFVVGSSVTTQQQLDRNRVNTATFL